MTLPEDRKDKDGLNTIGPAGETADPFVGRIVSGMPAGGSDDLDSKTDNELSPGHTETASEE